MGVDLATPRERATHGILLIFRILWAIKKTQYSCVACRHGVLEILVELIRVPR